MNETNTKSKISNEDIDKCRPKYKIRLLQQRVQDFLNELLLLLDKVEEVKAGIRSAEEDIQKVKESEEYKQSN